jgi:hypothetical protein
MHRRLQKIGVCKTITSNAELNTLISVNFSPTPLPFKALGLGVLGLISIRISVTAVALIIGDKSKHTQLLDLDQ